MRHGKPCLNGRPKVSPFEMKAWFEQYNQAGIGDDLPPDTGRKLASRASCIIASPAPRALASVRALGYEPNVIDAMFCEADLPVTHWRGPALSPFCWSFIFRLAWLCGYSRDVESKEKAGRRAKIAANRLISYAESGSVLLLGHGMFNHLIATRLKQEGWSEERNQGNGYWRAAIYKRDK
ncbi:histidine phosphatase family protein [Brenneria izadpanahii]|uniref:Histidine phosphatase family protein n=2 Tax=Brenneria izadpanahii TaxID=2722756 RepID=A0ABX7V4N7_9GAMM|nr:histidine phosphatase family protein [Brenneria izadpanahii]